MPRPRSSPPACPVAVPEVPLSALSTPRLSIRSQLLAAFGVVVVLLLAVGGLAIGRLSNESNHVTRLATRVVPATNIVGEMAATMNKYRKDQLHYILSTPAQRAWRGRRLGRSRRRSEAHAPAVGPVPLAQS